MQIVKKLKGENKKLKGKIKQLTKGIAIPEDEATSGGDASSPSRNSSKVNGKPVHVSHVTGLSTILDDSKIDISKHEKYVELQNRCDELSSELRQSKLENVKFEEMRVGNVSKIDELTEENEKNRKLVFEYESEINKLNETKIKQEFEIRTLKETNSELKQDWKETMESDMRKMHRSKTKANLVCINNPLPSIVMYTCVYPCT